MERINLKIGFPPSTLALPPNSEDVPAPLLSPRSAVWSRSQTGEHWAAAAVLEKLGFVGRYTVYQEYLFSQTLNLAT